MEKISEDIKKRVGSMLEPACLYANSPIGNIALKHFADIVKEYHCRGGVVHPGDVVKLFNFGCSKIVVVINFPNGRNGERGNLDQVRQVLFPPASQMAVIGFDVVINLWALEERNWPLIKKELSVVVDNAPYREVKAICQLPYVWKYCYAFIPDLLSLLADAGVTIVKDWTTIDNFSAPIAVSTEERIAYISHIKNLIEKNNLALKIKAAGKINEKNIIGYYKAGADIFGIGYPKTRNVFNTLCNYFLSCS